MKPYTYIPAILLLLVTSLSFAQDSLQGPAIQYPFGEPGAATRGVFGPDDRKEAQDAVGYQDFVRATAVMISKESLLGNTAYSWSLRQRLSQMFGTDKFDDNVKFLEQPALANCTGFLIAPDILVTAGHCIETLDDAEGYVWVFDYTSTMKFDPANGALNLDPNDVYEVAEVLSAKLDEFTDDDYSVLRLNRKSNRRPYRFRTGGDIAEGTGINTIGSPTGLPLKFSENAEVVDASPVNWFKSDIDSFPGNSGGPVFDDYGWIEGILVRGAVTYLNGDYSGDYYYDADCDCVKTVTFDSAVYTAGCQAHKITKIPVDLMYRSIYDNIVYAIENNMEDRFDAWAVYKWIFTNAYTQNRGLLEVVALSRNNYKIYDKILDYTFETYTDGQRRQILDYAVNNNNNTLYNLLLKRDIYIDAGADKPYTALQETISKPNLVWAQKLIDAGADTSVQDAGKNNLLHLAAATGDLTVINYVHNLNPNWVKESNSRGELPETLAKNKGNKSVFKYLKKLRKG
ncbi:trypsin-like peptidase domain-containing protein [Leeuwenhoekiella sp. H156]|uniref:trypsin-like serine peptidase n=1 Tax=Leeuwenhoekiella sp. H156 TaxID=3450128 RepID=UPI003FA41835